MRLLWISDSNDSLNKLLTGQKLMMSSSGRLQTLEVLLIVCDKLSSSGSMVWKESK